MTIVRPNWNSEWEDHRAQSETVGVIMLTAVIVILVGGFGVIYLGASDGGPTSDDPLLDAEVTVSNEAISVVHGGGATVDIADLTLLLRSDGTTTRYPFDAANVSRNVTADGRFEPGERFVRTHGLSPGPVTVMVIHGPTNAVVQQEYLDVPPADSSGTGAGGGSLVWTSASDWDGGAGETGVVHEPFGDRSAGRVELGYPSGGQWGPSPIAYWPLDEDSGTTAVDVVGTNDGTIQGATVGEGGTLGTTAYDFDGTDDYVDGATDITALRETASVAFWLNTTQSGDDTFWQAPGITGVESSGDGDDVFWGWLDASGTIGVQAGDQAGARSTTAVNDGTWHHVVLTRDASNGEVRVFVDGTLEDTATSRSGTIGTTFSSIGRIEDTGGTPAYFDGRLEDIQVYDSVLSAGDVSTLAGVTDGSLTTGSKSFASAVDPSGLTLDNVSATLPSGTSANVTVHSDPDGDGTFEETSDTIDLTGGTPSYSITGMSSASSTYRLEVALSTTDQRRSASVDRLELGT